LIDSRGRWTTSSVERIQEDLEELRQVGHRYAGSEGEREMLDRVRERLPEGVSSRIEAFVAFVSPAFVLGAHATALLGGGLLGLRYPLVAAVLCSFVTVSLLSEGTGRTSVLRRFLPKQRSYNLVWRRQLERPLGTLVLTAPLDIPRWRPDQPSWLPRPMRAVMYAAFVVTGLLWLNALAEPWGRPTQGMYVASLVVLGVTVLLGVAAHRRSEGVREDASGPAALLELVRRFQTDAPEGLDIWVVFTGCGYAYQNGMGAFLGMRGKRLPDPVLVLSFDEPGIPPLGAVVSEGPLIPQHHRPTGPALVERLRWAGLDIQSVDTNRITDARAAMLWGYRALALAGGGEGQPTAEGTLRAVEVAEAISRLYAEDLRRVPNLHPRLQGLLPAPTDPEPEGEGEPREEAEPVPVDSDGQATA
jgi:hypothetical protein